MRILASADLHGFWDVYDWLVGLAGSHKPDGVVLAGDLLGFPDGYDTVEEAQAADAQEAVTRLSTITCPVFYVMGNDDWVDLDSSVPNIQAVHGRRVSFGDFNVVGYQHTMPFMGGINEKPEHEMEKDLEGLRDLVDHNSVIGTSAPPQTATTHLPPGSAAPSSCSSLCSARSPEYSGRSSRRTPRALPSRSRLECTH